MGALLQTYARWQKMLPTKQPDRTQGHDGQQIQGVSYDIITINIAEQQSKRHLFTGCAEMFPSFIFVLDGNRHDDHRDPTDSVVYELGAQEQGSDVNRDRREGCREIGGQRGADGPEETEAARNSDRETGFRPMAEDEDGAHVDAPTAHAEGCMIFQVRDWVDLQAHWSLLHDVGHAVAAAACCGHTATDRFVVLGS
jgi:hypothetical protein